MSTQPNKFEPGQRVKVTGNGEGGSEYHNFPIGQPVTIQEYSSFLGAYNCVNEQTGIKQHINPEHLQPLNHD